MKQRDTFLTEQTSICLAPGLYQSNIIFNVAAYFPSLFHILGQPKPEVIENSALKRQAEYLAGRHAARCCLQELGVGAKPVPIGDNRSPQWPEGTIGSITHSDNQAICIAKLRETGEFLGIDIENWLESSCAMKIRQIVLTPSDNLVLANHPLTERQLVTLLFSAKESIFKALYPFVNEYFGFDVVDVVEINLNQKYVNLMLNQTLSKSCRAGLVLKVIFEFNKDYVLTRLIGKLKSN